MENEDIDIKQITLGRLIQLLDNTSSIFANEPNYKTLGEDKPIVFIGDTHGDFETTKKIVKKFGETHLLVFLGDYVDRAPEGQCSLNNICYLLELKEKNHANIEMLRGNHEFPEIFYYYGFGNEIYEIYENEDLLNNFIELFSQMPYVVTTKNGLIGLHGGLPNISSIDELRNIPKGIKHYSHHKIVSQIVWNDNLKDGASQKDGIFFSERDFKLDEAFLYGEPYFSKQMEILGKNVLVRGHDYQAKGFNLNKKVLTIFTSRMYADYGSLKGVYVAVMDDPKKEIKTAKDLRIEQID